MFRNNTYYIHISATDRKEQCETARSVAAAARKAPLVPHQQVGRARLRAWGIDEPSGSAHPPEPSQAVPPAAPPAVGDHDSSDSSGPPHPPSAGAVAANGKRRK